MKARIAMLAVLVAVAGVALAQPAPAQVAPGGIDVGVVISWTDGDTVQVRGDRGVRTVRLIGIDAPEIRPSRRAEAQAQALSRDVRTILMLGRRVRAAAERLAPMGTPVFLETDVRTHDRHGRMLAYLHTPHHMVNRELLRRGYAIVYTVPPNVRFSEQFLAAQREAREARRGLWAR
jgi:micrococcal nuclease